MIELIVLSLTSILNLLLGLAVYVKNPRGLTNKLFFLLTSVLTVWSLVNYVSVHPFLLSQLSWIRLTLFCGGILNLMVFVTFQAFPNYRLKGRYMKRVKLASIITLVVVPLTLTPLVFKSLKVVDGSSQPIPNPGIGLFLLQTILLLGGSVLTVISKYRLSKGSTKKQLKIVLIGIASTFGLIFLSNFLFVVLFNFTGLIPYGPSFTFIFICTMAYAIIRHRLFDIRAAVARSLAYILSLGLIGLIYGIALFGLTSLLKFSDLSIAERLFYVAMALLSALLFQPTRTFFNKATSRLFFRNAYDSQAIIDQVGVLVVNNIELNSIIHGTEKILMPAFNPAFIEFGLIMPSGKVGSAGGTSRLDLSSILELTSHIGNEVVIAEELSQQNELRGWLVKNNIGLCLKLDSNNQTIGYLFLGEKQNGEVYSPEDGKIIRIVANELSLAMQNALRFEEIKNFNETLQQKITNATRELRHTNEKLKALDEAKDEFISMASHQLRTPLTSVKGYVSMVLEGDVGKITAQQRQMLEQAYTSSQRMVYLIADLLNVSRLKTGKFVIEPVQSQLADVIEGELEQLKETAKARNLELTYEKPANFPIVTLDETKTRQVIMNFIDNAIYYTPAGGHIKVELSATPDKVEYRVIDDGLGVPKSEQPHLFTKFYRAGNAKKARPDGTGLGLYMAKKVIIAQGGSIIFESEEGKGSTFGFTLPIKPPAVKA